MKPEDLPRLADTLRNESVRVEIVDHPTGKRLAMTFGKRYEDGSTTIEAPIGSVRVVMEAGDVWREEYPSTDLQTTEAASGDPVNHPRHYNAHPSGIEAIVIIEHMPFNVGTAMKYLWRAGLKGDAIEDLKKAAWYVNREIAKREKEGNAT